MCRSCYQIWWLANRESPEAGARRRERQRVKAALSSTPASREAARCAWFRHKYGVSLVDKARMFDAQGGVCAVCREVMAKVCVDHDHETGAVRGLLCNGCNSGLGMFRDDTATMLRAVEYLNASRERKAS